MIFQLISGLVQQGIQVKLIDLTDEIYVTNRLLSLLNLEALPAESQVPIVDTIPNILEEVIAYAVDHHVIEDVFDDREILAANIMNCFVARPSVINRIFQEKYSQSPQHATDYFYELSKNSNYIQLNRIEKNIQFKTKTVYGEMDITINMSKPEKDPEQIKRESQLQHKIDYPKCLLCIENVGYEGRIGYPARANHRVIKIPLAKENWYLQYSPYVYYNEHSILLAEQHRNMKVTRDTFVRLLTFIEKFPHYFIGSNADLPIVGGSILSHDHYQAGRYEFPMTNAATAMSFTLEQFTRVSAAVLNWPLSTIRLQSIDTEELIQAADHILTTWKNYDDEQVSIKAFTGNTPHNTITPIARMRDGQFELDLVLRNNRTTAEHPLGIFHPHADVHHIKKENIGLIEVMGLAVLPARLKDELADIKNFLQNQSNTVPSYHQPWADELKEKYGLIQDTIQLELILEKELGDKFAKVLSDAGVFKDFQAYECFIYTLNHKAAT
ncbi:UDP-glucose--hexose-1-phosphate uridylyltransferase [Sporosarcina sp. BI001-red]|uniref:UDP-glucose--hexose-1-phosphate uridylyltransferase n=1 Tax=Sporosarcina sp. BI001-red TaxID=2282866 RepID=UPI000E249204|nr:UDP-glucose--hexose-1-phosphate uridylyltransferase [Sporosarcina sp. BI001-red]REB10098.1 UDP-glucose--hexose-1-phosphate uridylyltransferase [Sporosarcina sp. BI001-red]